MKSVLFQFWLAAEFLLIYTGAFRCGLWVIEEISIEGKFLRFFIIGILPVFLGGLGLVMNFHPHYKFSLRYKNKTEKPND